MKRINVKSSSIKSVGYCIEDEILEIEFTRGAIYKYYKVLPKIFCELMFSESVGKYFDQHIKKKYNYEKIGE